MAKTFAEIVASVRKNYPDLFRAPVLAPPLATIPTQSGKINIFSGKAPTLPSMADIYAAQVDLYKTEVDHYADSLRYGMSQARYALPGLFPKKEKPMNDTPLFSVFRASNGFYATYGGKVVVGATMSEVCAAVSAAIADEIVREEQRPDFNAAAKLPGDPWQKVT